jgi:hypothetical protein
MFRAASQRPPVRPEQLRSRLAGACAAFAGALRHPDRRVAGAEATAADLSATRLADQRVEDELVMVAAAHVAKVAPLPSAGL